ncbi:MAG: zinc-dependent metalloprotease [Thermoleophilaceae bacterium]|jgi:coenzyme F420 biosynthesis associated uncharacterized protein|nr:zinc-dependent metalloprotease [Thermoleophilaceae bacterium]
MVDWSLARQIARFAAGSAPVPDLGIDLGPEVELAGEEVARHTGLQPAVAIPTPEVLARADWAEANLATLSSLLDPVADRLGTRLGTAGPLAGPLRAAASATVAAEAGLVLGYMSQRVLGQYELSLLQPEAPPRLLFVGPNLLKAVREMDVERESFLRWVALHEVTHVIQFGAVPWLRGYLGELLEQYLATVDIRIERGAAGGLPSMPDPARIVEAFREGGLMALVQSREQRRLMNRVQAAMALVEGYSEHVMDAVGARILPAHEPLREAMDRRRSSRSAPERALQRLLGLDLKMRQYELGKRFCDAVVAAEGLERLNRAWDAPAELPTLSELERPRTWLERDGRAKAA